MLSAPSHPGFPGYPDPAADASAEPAPLRFGVQAGPPSRAALVARAVGRSVAAFAVAIPACVALAAVTRLATGSGPDGEAWVVGWLLVAVAASVVWVARALRPAVEPASSDQRPGSLGRNPSVWRLSVLLHAGGLTGVGLAVIPAAALAFADGAYAIVFSALWVFYLPIPLAAGLLGFWVAALVALRGYRPETHPTASA